MGFPEISRREAPRLEVEALIDGRATGTRVPLNLVDLGFGGFAVESSMAFEVGSRHGFQFTTVDGITVLLRADTVYCRPVTGRRDEEERHVAGFRYVVQTTGERHAVDILIDCANSPLQFR